LRAKRLVIVIVFLLLAGGGWWLYNANHAGKLAGIQATGTIEGTEVDLSAEEAGVVQNLSVDEGDAVQQDQVIATIYRSDLVAQRDQAAAAVAVAQANLDDLLSGARAQQIAEDQANVQVAEANYSQALDNLSRNQELSQSGAISASAFEQYQTAVSVDKNQLAAAQAALNLLQAGSTADAITAASDQVKQSEAALQQAQAVLSDLPIVSPINAIVISKNYQQGEYVPVGAPIVTIENLNNLWIELYIPADQLPGIKLGQRAQFTISGTAQVFTGTVEEINSQGEFTLKTIQTTEEQANVVFGVKIRIANNDGGVLKPGMPANVTFVTGKQ
jgi:HlyD family secretion protein